MNEDDTESDQRRIEQLEKSTVPRGEHKEFENEYVREFLDRMKFKAGNDVSDGKYKSHRSAFRNYIPFLDIPATEVEFLDVEDFADWLALNGYRQKSIDNYIPAIGNFHTFLNRRYQMNMPDLDGIQGSNYKNIPSIIERKAIPRKEVKMVFESAENLREVIVIGFLYYAGCRRSELSDLKISDIDMEEKRVRIRKSKHDKSRVTSFHDDFRWPLTAWLNEERDTYPTAAKSDYVIIGTRSESISPSSVYRIVRKTADKAGVQEIIDETADGRDIYRVTPHTFRHSFATHAWNDDMDIFDIKTLMGHSEIGTTLEYIDENVDDSIDEYQDRFDGIE